MTYSDFKGNTMDFSLYFQVNKLLNAGNKMSNTAKGNLGEKAVMRALREQGFKVTRRRNSGYDLIATNKDTGVVTRIEVKLATKGKDSKFRATTVKCGRYGSTDYRKSDYVIMLCATDNEVVPFIIPCESINARQIAITSNPTSYNGKYAEFRNSWENLQ